MTEATISLGAWGKQDVTLDCSCGAFSWAHGVLGNWVRCGACGKVYSFTIQVVTEEDTSHRGYVRELTVEG